MNSYTGTPSIKVRETRGLTILAEAGSCASPLEQALHLFERPLKGFKVKLLHFSTLHQRRRVCLGGSRPC